MENKNIIIAFVLMLVVWVGINVLTPVFFPSEDPVVEETAEIQPESNINEVNRQEISSQRETPGLTAASPLTEKTLEQRDITVETETYRTVLTNSGARVKSFTLKQYQKTPAADSPLVDLVDTEQSELATLRTSGLGDIGFSSETIFAISTKEKNIKLSTGEEQQIIFSAQTPQGIRIDKIYTFRGEGYDFDLQVQITNLSSSSLRGALSLSLVQPWEDTMTSSRYSFVGPAVLQNGKVQTYDVEDLEEQSIELNTASWTAFERKYFMSALVPIADAGEKFRIAKVGKIIENSTDSTYRIFQPGESAQFDYLVYFGPRDLDILQNVGYELSEAIDFGFFGIIARPLLTVLKFFYQYVGNYGIAIILLTVIIKLLFWPLTQKSYKSMKSMQTLQPEMQKIRSKHKSDKERMNKEIMELYKNNRVNPMGGCLPMFVQIPVFFALYKVLLGTIELRHAPFIFWLQDLSAKDPYYITPIIMGATMFIQQKMSPSTMDPTQAKVFMFMPLIFTFMFLNFPSGLVIYWLINNLLTILQQWFINRDTKPVVV